MIEAKERYVDAVLVKRYLKDNYDMDLQSMTGQEVVDRLFGGYNNDYYSEFRIIDDCWTPKTKWWQRLNRFWAYSLTAVCAPYQYIKNGEIGWSDKTRFGLWILRVTGYR